MAVDDPFVPRTGRPVTLCQRTHLRGVRPGKFGFGHREARPDMAFFEWLQVRLFQMVGGVLMQQFHVANVGGLTIEGVMPKRAVGQHFAYLPKFAQTEAQPALVDAVLQAPQPGPPHEFALLVQDFGHLREVTRQVLSRFERDNLVFDEFANAGNQFTGVVGGKYGFHAMRFVVGIMLSKLQKR